jgi:crossover junction endodeoxyribonuclease RusA
MKCNTDEMYYQCNVSLLTNTTNCGIGIQVFRIVVPGEPIPKARPRLASNGRAYTPAATVNYERSIARIAQSTRPRDWPMTSRYCVDMTFERSTRRRVDLDNLVKSALDGLLGIAYDDDHRVHELRAKIVLGALKPGATIVVSELPS